MQEIEILARINDDLASAQQKLTGLEFVGEKITRDIYFYDPKRKDLKPDDQKHLHASFRLRAKDGTNYIAYKQDNFDQDGTWTHSDEHETEIADFATAEKIIDSLGLKKLVEIHNTKHIYQSETYEIVLEDVKDLGIFLEVELKTTEFDVDIASAKDSIRRFITKLGFEYEELHQGKPELMLQKQAATMDS